MTNMWQDLKKWLEEASKVVGKEAGDLTLKGRLKIEIFELHRKLDEYYAGLGQLVFTDVFVKKSDDWPKKSEVRAIVKKIRNAQRSLKKKQIEYKKIGKQTKAAAKST